MGTTGILLTHFDNEDKPALMDAIRTIASESLPYPLGEALVILDETEDIEVIAALLEVMLLNLDDVAQEVMNGEYQRAADHVKRHLILVMSLAQRSTYMQFLLHDYFENAYNRPAIRQISFKNKAFLFMNLARYMEGVALTKRTIATCQQLLKMIPREVVLDAASAFSGTTIMDVYYAMPLEDRLP